MKKMFRVLAVSLIATLALTAVTSQAQMNTNTPVPAPKMRGGMNGFRQGKVESVDLTAKTITIKNKTLGERVLKQDATTTLMLDGKPATLADIKPGYYASGSLHMEGTNEFITKGMFFKEKPVRPSANMGGTNAVPKAAAAQ